MLEPSTIRTTRKKGESLLRNQLERTGNRGCRPTTQLNSNLSAILCLRINHTNPLINLRLLLDNTNIPLRVIPTNTLREGGVSSGWNTDRFPVPMHAHKRLYRHCPAPQPPTPVSVPNSVKGLCPDCFR